MDGSVKYLVLCGHLLAVAAAAPIDSSLEDIAEVIHFTNKYLGTNFLFKLLRAEDDGNYYVSENSTKMKSLKFFIKETTCPISDTEDKENCEFKPVGVVMACVADIITDHHEKKITGQCVKEINTPKGAHAMKRELADKTQGTFEISVDLKKTHKEECLECIITLLPEHP
ncbi:cathelin-related peptide SC5-like [Hyla sarda]|uniref:cathelin-related peptide SC5-like n=1 Tax=Hyla sarda TaxID=327740 RepID=UPI0024C2362A|nr:cathelin-related peptide SC5-like [Hyla sarda]